MFITQANYGETSGVEPVTREILRKDVFTGPRFHRTVQAITTSEDSLCRGHLLHCDDIPLGNI